MDVPKPKKRKRGPWIVGALFAVLTLGAGVGVARVGPAVPSVDRETIWTDTVVHGEMVRQVKGPGTLVSEDIRRVSALAPGRVERMLVQPGEEVRAGQVLVELSNPDVQRQALEANRLVAAARAELQNLSRTLEGQRLSQELAVASATGAVREAQRQVTAQETLLEQGLASANEVSRARDDLDEARVRLRVEEGRLGYAVSALTSQVRAQGAQVELLDSLAAFQTRQIDALTVRASTNGLVKELPLELGQWVQSGMTLGTIVQPGRLKAVLRIPEIQAKDLAVGQLAAIDTRIGISSGHVARIDPAVQNGTVSVVVALTGALPSGARPDLTVEGTIDVERLPNATYVGRPAYGQPQSVIWMYRLEPGGTEAVRIQVRLGRGSATNVEVLQGLRAGDIVVLSDVSEFHESERLRLRRS